MKATRIYADAAGISHFADIDVPLKTAGAIGRLSEVQPGVGVVFRETEPTYDYDWHQAPRKQWIVLLDGEIAIETGDGEKRTFRGGDVLLVEDTHGRGHKTKQLSAGIRHSLFIPIP
jgi:uncharacterized cupin superfamily protein